MTGATNNTAEPATTAHVFMVQSLLPPSKNVAHTLPVSRMNAETLHEFVVKFITLLEELEIRVVVIVTDNNALNHKMMLFFALPPKAEIVYPHPAVRSRPHFYVIDPVHLLKCGRKNWLNKRT